MDDSPKDPRSPGCRDLCKGAIVRIDTERVVLLGVASVFACGGWMKTLAAWSQEYCWPLFAPTLFLLTCSATAQSDADADPLFAGDDPLNVKIVAPLTSIMFNREDDKDVPGTFQFLDTDGRLVEFDIGLRTRGNFRRQRKVCLFVPLRLNFKTSQTDKTLFRQQDKLKLVTHCQSAIEYQGNVLREYLAYRIFNILTNISFRVRLLSITYVDTDNNNREIISYGFLIEHKEKLAQRIGVPTAQVSRMFLPDLQSAYTNLTSLFHYFLGNTDFSQIGPETGDSCCHNHAPFSNVDGSYFSIPFDFDMSGFVDAEYSEPARNFGPRKPRRRLYRGWCTNNAHLPASVQLFNEKRGEIYELIDSFDLLSSVKRKSLLRFIDRFYASVESPKKIEKNLVKHCKESD